MTSQFDEMYRGGAPPWDIGEPQPSLVALAERGVFVGDVLDCGCGTGENAIFLARRRHRVVGVDISRVAIDQARAKATARGVSVELRVGDALALASLGRRFDTILDCGLFHTFATATRPRYAESLRSVSKLGTRFVLLCFSEHEPDWGGPYRVRKDELDGALGGGWLLNRVEPVRFASLIAQEGAAAWLATYTHVGPTKSHGN